jgi:hypothetical protein
MAAQTLPAPSAAISTVPDLVQCFFSDEHCDCRDLGTVHHLASEQEFCPRHFEAVNRG